MASYRVHVFDILQGPSWHPHASLLFSPCSYPKVLQFIGVPLPRFSFLQNTAILATCSLGPAPFISAPPPPISCLHTLCLSLSLSDTPPPISRPYQICQPSSVYYFLSLLWIHLDASGCTLLHVYNKNLLLSNAFSSVTPWSSSILSLYIVNEHLLYRVISLMKHFCSNTSRVGQGLNSGHQVCAFTCWAYI